MHIATEDKALALREWQNSDRDSLVRYANNRRVWRNLTDMFPHPYTYSDADNWISMASSPAPSIHLAIELNGEAVGGAGVIAGERNSFHTGQFGYWLGEPHWGKGVATKVARALKNHAFSGTRFKRLEAPVFAWNPASMRVLEKAGFSKEGTLAKSVLKDGLLIDSVLYAVTSQA